MWSLKEDGWEVERKENDILSWENSLAKSWSALEYSVCLRDKEGIQGWKKEWECAWVTEDPRQGESH